jgi:hypothetical protein
MGTFAPFSGMLAQATRWAAGLEVVSWIANLAACGFRREPTQEILTSDIVSGLLV